MTTVRETLATGSSARGRADMLFRALTAFCAVLIVLIILGIFIELLRNSQPALSTFGLRFLTSTAWDPVKGNFGAATSLFGTAVSTLIALVVAGPLAFVIAFLLVELSHPIVSRVVGTAIELLAAVPSIIYGMWGLFVLVPIMQERVQPFLKAELGWIPGLGVLFSGPPMGIGMLTAGIILALMILPYITAVSRDALAMVPPVIKEAAHGMGSTTWEVTRKVSLRHSLRGIVGALFLGLGRALGETIAVTFVIGNNHRIFGSLFAAGNTIASTLANEFTEADSPLYLSALVELGLALFVITFLFQVAAHWWINRQVRASGVHA